MSRRCSVAGCDQPMLVGVGINAEPMCQRHYEEWLAACKDTIGSFFRALSGRRTPEPEERAE